MNKFGCGAIGQLPPGGRGGHFPKWPPADTRKTTEVRLSLLIKALMNVYWMFWIKTCQIVI